MLPTSARFYNPTGPDRVAEVAVEQATDPDFLLIQVRRGAKSAKMRPPATLGPYTPAQVPAQFDDAVRELRLEGFWPAGLHALLTDLGSPTIAVRARAALRLGWRREREAVEPLLNLLPEAVDETCSLVDALGAIGDPRAIPAVRQQAARLLLSRRRSAVEALRNLGDSEGLAEAQQRARERLPASVRERLEGMGTGSPEEIAQAVLALDVKEQGLALDTLYEVAEPRGVAAAWQVMDKLAFDRAFLWRYVKSVFKRAMLRHDYEMFGWIAHAIEERGLTTKGTTATVKSGYDGSLRQTRIFSRTTQDFLRRLSWRYLRRLARYRPESYALAAAEALIHYTPPQGQNAYNEDHYLGPVYLPFRILWGNSTRFRFKAREMRFSLRSTKHAKAPANVREEAYPHLWDRQPRAYLRVLSAAKLVQAQKFAYRAVTTRHADLIETATPAELVGMLRAPYTPTVELALKELERRFDPANPDWVLLEQLLADEREMARDIGRRWLRLTVGLWAANPERIAAFLVSGQPETRALVLELARERIAADLALRQRLAQLAVGVLKKPEIKPGAHDIFARLAREYLTAEMEDLLSVAELVHWATHGSAVAKELAGNLLRLRPSAAMELGLEKLTALAQHEVAAVRSAAHALLQGARDELRVDPSILFVLVESDWDDTRTAAFTLLRQIDAAALGLDGIMGLLDSNRVDVQEFGREMALKHFADLPAEELVYRLVQHPHPGMRRFALELVVHHLPSGDGPLAKLKEFCRAALFDLWPSRKVKRGVVEFLTARGLEDARQAALVSAILGDVVRVQGRADFENALEALVRIKMAYPDVPSTVTVAAEV
jgi:HEAT repeat protein